MKKAPSLIIGMHRSGTSLLSECLEELGWYGGWLKNRSNESTFYVRINDWILQNCGVDWESVNNIDSLIDINYDLLKTAVERVEKYIGWLEYDKCSTNSLGNWGFKDPRTSFTLPFWSRCYPDLKIVHIKRHGVDVARSLIKRKQEHRILRQKNTFLTDIWDIYKGNKLYTTTVTSDINDALNLWYKYEQRCLVHVENHEAISVTYESLLDKPFEVLSLIAEFLGLEASKSDCIRAAAMIDKSRSLAYKRSFQADNLNGSYKQKLNEMGYDL